MASALGALALAATLGGSRYGLRRMAFKEGPLEASSGTYETFIEANGSRRRVLVHVPPAIARGAAMPLVLALHGASSTGERLDDLIRLTPIADREGFIVAFPDALDKVWKASRPVPADDVHDDVAFLTAVVEALGHTLPLDRARVYAAGFSNGAMMANRLACEAGDRFAAVALVAGVPAVGVLSSSKPPRPVPVIAFHGTEDRIIRYEGGSFGSLIPGRARGSSIAVEELKRFWVEANGCEPEPEREILPNRASRPSHPSRASRAVSVGAPPFARASRASGPSSASGRAVSLFSGDGTYVEREAYAGKEGADVVFYKVVGGGHTWPGGKQFLPRQVAGNTNRSVNASELIWRFFAAHPMS